MFFCRILTVQMLSGRNLAFIDQALLDGNAPTAAVRLPQLLPNDKRFVDGNLPEKGNRHRDRRVRLCPKSPPLLVDELALPKPSICLP